MAKQTVKPSKSGNFVGILVVIAVVGIAVIAYLANGKGSKAVTVDPNVPAGAAQGYRFGREDAPVQILEFGDFECPSCGNAYPLLEAIYGAYEGKLRMVFKNFPLPAHAHAKLAAQAAIAAAF